jgi:N-acetylmuramic acid 6-phosphate etherase
MISVFTDLTERSPTFGLSPIDTVNTKEKKSWISMFTNGKNKYHAWELFLGRRFKGLKSEAFLPGIENESDHELRHKGIMSLKKTGKDQEDLYDFSLS